MWPLGFLRRDAALDIELEVKKLKLKGVWEISHIIIFPGWYVWCMSDVIFHNRYIQIWKTKHIQICVFSLRSHYVPLLSIVQLRWRLRHWCSNTVLFCVSRHLQVCRVTRVRVSRAGRPRERGRLTTMSLCHLSFSTIIHCSSGFCPFFSAWKRQRFAVLPFAFIISFSIWVFHISFLRFWFNVGPLRPGPGARCGRPDGDGTATAAGDAEEGGTLKRQDEEMSGNIWTYDEICVNVKLWRIRKCV